MHPSAPSTLRTPAGTAHIVIGSLASGRPRYHVDGAPIDLDVTIPDDLAAYWYWFGPFLAWHNHGLSICANTCPPPRCFELARDWMRREQEQCIVQEKFF